MTSILLVDDESLIRNIIARQLDMSGIYSVVAQASDGFEALEKIKEHQPQIVISDISMPNFDGLYLAKVIQEEFPQIRVVIMSGYNNFEYAQKALKYGVKEYLLKPFLPQDLMTVLEKLRKEIELASLASDDERTLRRNFLISLIKDDTLDTVKIMGLLPLLHIDLYPNNYCLSIVSCFVRQEQDFTIRNTVIKRVEVLLSSLACDSIKLVPFLDTSNRLTVIWSFNLSSSVFRKRVEEIARKINEDIEKDYHVFVYFAFGSQVGSLVQVKNAYKEAEQLWMMQFGKDEVLDFYTTESISDERRKEELTRIDALKDELLVRISLKDRDVFDMLTQYFLLVSEAGLSDFHLASTLIVNFFFDLSERIKTEVNQKYFSQFFASCFNKDKPYANIFYSFNLAHKAVSSYFDAVEREQKDQTNVIVDSIVHQVNKNIGNPEFSVEDAFVSLDYSSSYMRYLFSQKMHMSIKEYLTKVRMETAKKLLKENRLLIKDIAAQVGFQNQRYFASTFKSYYSISPTEYKDQVCEK